MRTQRYALCGIFLLATLWLTPSSWAFDRPGHATAVAPVHKEGDSVPLSCDLAGNCRFTLGTTIAGEDIAIDVLKVEQRFTTLPDGASTGLITADTLISSGAGYVDTLSCYGTDGAAVAGTIQLRDSLTAGAGNVLYTLAIGALDYHVPFFIPVHTVYANGLYLDYTTTTDVNCHVSFR